MLSKRVLSLTKKERHTIDMLAAELDASMKNLSKFAQSIIAQMLQFKFVPEAKLLEESKLKVQDEACITICPSGLYKNASGELATTFRCIAAEQTATSIFRAQERGSSVLHYNDANMTPFGYVHEVKVRDDLTVDVVKIGKDTHYEMHIKRKTVRLEFAHPTLNLRILMKVCLMDDGSVAPIAYRADMSSAAVNMTDKRYGHIMRIDQSLFKAGRLSSFGAYYDCDYAFNSNAMTRLYDSLYVFLHFYFEHALYVTSYNALRYIEEDEKSKLGYKSQKTEDMLHLREVIRESYLNAYDSDRIEKALEDASIVIDAIKRALS